jgi:hypothetical protein
VESFLGHGRLYRPDSGKASWREVPLLKNLGQFDRKQPQRGRFAVGLDDELAAVRGVKVPALRPQRDASMKDDYLDERRLSSRLLR